MRSNRIVLLIALLISTVFVWFPLVALLLNTSTSETASNHADSFLIISRTFGWAFSTGLIATAVGWPLGLRLASCSVRMRRLISTTLLLTLAVPSYAIFYAWWQVWPAGSSLHHLIIKYDVLPFATKSTLACSLVGWSWPIASLIAAMCISNRSSLQLLHNIDGVSLYRRLLNHMRLHSALLIVCVILIASITAANTTCFDLGQVHTIGNELRAIVATGGFISDAPMLGWSSLLFACIASIVVIRMTSKNKDSVIAHATKSAWPVILVWIFLSGGPVIVGSIHASMSDSFLLFSQYGGDIARSLSTALMTGIGCLIILFVSAILHASISSRTRKCASCLDYLWIAAALLPATLVSEAEMLAWNRPYLDTIYRSPFLLVFAQIAHIGFVGSLGGRWVAASKPIRLLICCDAPKSMMALCLAIRSRLVVSAIVVFAITIAISMGEVAMTTQLSQPATNQPISVALLNAMHYQRPQIVTSVMLLFVIIAVVAGVVVAMSTRRISFLVLFSVCLIGCSERPAQQDGEVLTSIVIGSTGKADGRFVTPRAVDYHDGVLVVIDKTGRLQRFNKKGQHLSTWSLPPTGNGFPTGVSIDEGGNIWIADTHGHRVRVLDSTGKELFIFGEYGTDDGQFLYPTDIAFGKSGHVYVSEYGGNDRISVFDQRGSFLHSFGHHGKEPDGFRRPQSLAIDLESDLLYITDSANHRIVVYDTNGTLIRTFGSVGNEKGELLYPYSISLLDDGTFLVTEFGNNRLQRFSSLGESLGVMGSAGSTEGQFKMPWGAVIIEDGILVIDTGNNRLQLLDGFMM